MGSTKADGGIYLEEVCIGETSGVYCESSQDIFVYPTLKDVDFT